MLITKHHSLVVADKVLTLLRVILRSQPGPPLTVTTYSNCREQGYHIVTPYHGSAWSRAVSFAQQRNSDDIRVWYGPAADFDMQGIPRENAKGVGDRCFPRLWRRQAALFIADYLTTGRIK